MGESAGREGRVIVAVAMRLPRIRALEIEAHCAAQIGWNGHGHGQVEIRRETAADVVFTETGRFEPGPGAPGMRFVNPA